MGALLLKCCSERSGFVNRRDGFRFGNFAPVIPRVKDTRNTIANFRTIAAIVANAPAAFYMQLRVAPRTAHP